MSQQPHARRGRRNPDIQNAMDSIPGGLEIAPDPDEEHTDIGEPEHVPALVFDGDVVTFSATLAVKFDPDEKESYFGTKLTTRVQPGETGDEVYARAVTFVNEAVINQIDDVSDRLEAYTAERNARTQRALS